VEAEACLVHRDQVVLRHAGGRAGVEFSLFRGHFDLTLS
jgi:hypothetical protein